MNITSCTLRIGVDKVLQDVQFAPTAASALPTGPLQLQFLSIVDTTKIPFSFIAGPAQDIWTKDEVTSTWFAEQLTPAFTQETETSPPCLRTGILASLQDASQSPEKGTPFTEILFFAAPPATSTPDDDSFTLKAIPLNSEIPSYLPSPPTSPSAPNNEAQFLPPLDQLRDTAQVNIRKRKQVSTVFDEATERRAKARRHGGESVAAAASTGGINVLVGQKKPKPNRSANALPQSQAGTRQHSRTGSVHEEPRGGRLLSRSPSMSSDIRPSSRKGLEISAGGAKRSTLSRVSSLADTASTEERNKDAISRLVMAGMRLYGLTQRKKSGHARRVSQVHGGAAGIQGANVLAGVGEDEAREREKDEEYKLLYHQTYKGTVFAFRRAIAVKPLYTDVAAVQETVDKLLGIFCGDPLAPT